MLFMLRIMFSMPTWFVPEDLPVESEPKAPSTIGVKPMDGYTPKGVFRFHYALYIVPTVTLTANGNNGCWHCEK